MSNPEIVLWWSKPIVKLKISFCIGLVRYIYRERERQRDRERDRGAGGGGGGGRKRQRDRERGTYVL